MAYSISQKWETLVDFVHDYIENRDYFIQTLSNDVEYKTIKGNQKKIPKNIVKKIKNNFLISKKKNKLNEQNNLQKNNEELHTKKETIDYHAIDEEKATSENQKKAPTVKKTVTKIKSTKQVSIKKIRNIIFIFTVVIVALSFVFENVKWLKNVNNIVKRIFKFLEDLFKYPYTIIKSNDTQNVFDTSKTGGDGGKGGKGGEAADGGGKNTKAGEKGGGAKNNTENDTAGGGGNTKAGEAGDGEDTKAGEAGGGGNTKAGEAGDGEDTKAGEAGGGGNTKAGEAGDGEDTKAGEAGDGEDTKAGEKGDGEDTKAGEKGDGEDTKAGEKGDGEDTKAGEKGDGEDTKAGEAGDGEDTKAGEKGDEAGGGRDKDANNTNKCIPYPSPYGIQPGMEVCPNFIPAASNKKDKFKVITITKQEDSLETSEDSSKTSEDSSEISSDQNALVVYEEKYTKSWITFLNEYLPDINKFFRDNFPYLKYNVKMSLLQALGITNETNINPRYRDVISDTIFLESHNSNNLQLGEWSKRSGLQKGNWTKTF